MKNLSIIVYYMHLFVFRHLLIIIIGTYEALPRLPYIHVIEYVYY